MNVILKEKCVQEMWRERDIFISLMKAVQSLTALWRVRKSEIKKERFFLQNLVIFCEIRREMGEAIQNILFWYFFLFSHQNNQSK